jgi:hypothetical protein
MLFIASYFLLVSSSYAHLNRSIRSVQNTPHDEMTWILVGAVIIAILFAIFRKRSENHTLQLYKRGELHFSAAPATQVLLAPEECVIMATSSDMTLFICKENKGAHKYEPRKVSITVTDRRIFFYLNTRYNSEYKFSEFDHLIAPFVIAFALEDVAAFNFVGHLWLGVQRISLWREDAQTAVEFTQIRWMCLLPESRADAELFRQVLRDKSVRSEFFTPDKTIEVN